MVFQYYKLRFKYKKIYFIFFLALMGIPLLSAQNFDKSGAIKTKDGFLLYLNNDKESYTINLKGEINLYPENEIIEINGNFFSINHIPKSKFGILEDEILTNFQNWEHEYLESDIFKIKIPIKNKRPKIGSQHFNFWYFEIPKDPTIFKPASKTFYLDFIHGQTIYSFKHSSFKGNEKEAYDFLLGIFESMHFYVKGIDIAKLRERILKGENFY